MVLPNWLRQSKWTFIRCIPIILTNYFKVHWIWETTNSMGICHIIRTCCPIFTHVLRRPQYEPNILWILIRHGMDYRLSLWSSWVILQDIFSSAKTKETNPSLHNYFNSYCVDNHPHHYIQNSFSKHTIVISWFSKLKSNLWLKYHLSPYSDFNVNAVYSTFCWIWIYVRNFCIKISERGKTVFSRPMELQR